MASVSRQKIDDALFGRISKFLPQTVKTVSRRLKGWDEVPAMEQPAVFVVKRNESITRQKGLPSKILAKFDIVIYVNTGGDHSVSPSELLNPILDAVCDSLEPDGCSLYQDLGLPNVVSHAAINGEIFTDEGVLGEQSFAVVPVEVLWL